MRAPFLLFWRDELNALVVGVNIFMGVGVIPDQGLIKRTYMAALLCLRRPLCEDPDLGGEELEVVVVQPRKHPLSVADAVVNAL